MRASSGRASSTFDRLQSEFFSLRRALAAALAEYFYEHLVQEKSELEVFFTNFIALKSAFSFEAKHETRHLTTKGFVKTEVLTASGVFCTFHLKNASELLRNQIESAQDRDINF